MSPLEIYLIIGLVFAAYVAVTERTDEVKEAFGELFLFALLVVAYPLMVVGRIALIVSKPLRLRFKRAMRAEEERLDKEHLDRIMNQTQKDE